MKTEELDWMSLVNTSLLPPVKPSTAPPSHHQTLSCVSSTSVAIGSATSAATLGPVIAEGRVWALPGSARPIVMSGRGVIGNPLFCTVNDNEMTLHPMKPRISIEAAVGGKYYMATEALKSNPRHVNSDDWYYTTKQFFL
ncbi:hypothetical protein E2C01_034953 [Portunus trituberculatus]|uniref:Uncharacterized protein n=1 Tax=Portunus trituberculatus TaxID=210409 RepID=A0A5B7FA62_PORTR|nr:hypothetical protein [Portunus trituberculatus]